MSSSTYVKFTQYCVFGAAVVMTFGLWYKMPPPFMPKEPTVNDVIDADRSDRQAQQSLDRVLGMIKR